MKLLVYIILSSLLVSCSTVERQAETAGPSYNQYLDGFEYPFPVKTFDLASQKQKLKFRYMDVGERKAKKVALLLHGKNFSGFYWKRIATELMQRGYRVIIPDQIGFGKSSKPKFYQYSFVQMAMNTEALLKHLAIKDKVSVVGHSMGGMLAVHYALNYQDQVKQVILINPVGLEPYAKYTELKDPEFFYNRLEKNKTIVKIRNYQKKNYYDGKWNESYEELIKIHEGWLNGPDWPTVAWNNALTYLPIFAEDITRRLPELRTEVSLIIGTRDRTGPGRGWMKKGTKYELGRYDRLGKTFKRTLPSATVIELENLGHMPQFEDYKRFAKAFYKLL